MIGHNLPQISGISKSPSLVKGLYVCGSMSSTLSHVFLIWLTQAQTHSHPLVGKIYTTHTIINYFLVQVIYLV